jgi:hypothetical protein
VSPALVVSGECTVEAERAGVDVIFSVGVTEFGDESKNVESNAPSDESTRVPAGIAVGPFELGMSAVRGAGMRAGTSAAVNCAAAAVGAAASAIAATAAAQVLTMISSGHVSMLAGTGSGHFRCHALDELTHAVRSM